jgi:hypothetical protein
MKMQERGKKWGTEICPEKSQNKCPTSQWNIFSNDLLGYISKSRHSTIMMKINNQKLHKFNVLQIGN